MTVDEDRAERGKPPLGPPIGDLELYAGPYDDPVYGPGVGDDTPLLAFGFPRRWADNERRLRLRRL